VRIFAHFINASIIEKVTTANRINTMIACGTVSTCHEVLLSEDVNTMITTNAKGITNREAIVALSSISLRVSLFTDMAIRHQKTGLSLLNALSQSSLYPHPKPVNVDRYIGNLGLSGQCFE
jgi:hypothetical protein